MTTALLLAAAFFLAYSNGANDNFKGVATLYGSGTANFRSALVWATVATFAGALTAGMLAQGLIALFSGKGLVPAAALDHTFMTAATLGAAATVFFTALAGIPISTTHALTGALAGAGLLAAGGEIDFSVLGRGFFYPLALSPLVAIALVSTLALVWRTRERRPSATQRCVCVGETRPAVAVAATGAARRSLPVLGGLGLRAAIGSVDACARAGLQTGLVFPAGGRFLRDHLHFLSAGAVSFARGVNDTPKIAAIALAAAAFDADISIYLIAACMALGGLLHSARMADTLAHKVVAFTPSEGTLANLVTSALVIFASNWGLPVSTTHVAVSSLFGLGVVKGEANWALVGGILCAWLLTLPTALCCSAALYLFMA
jgi:PiT family inorganic phosphate transporter